MLQRRVTPTNSVIRTDWIEMIVCNCDNKICMVHGCDKCSGTDSLREYLETLLDEHEDLTFLQWQTTYRSKMVTQNLNLTKLLTCWLELLKPNVTFVYS